MGRLELSVSLRMGPLYCMHIISLMGGVYSLNVLGFLGGKEIKEAGLGNLGLHDREPP